MQMLVDADIGSQVLTEGHEPRGTVLSFEGVQHRIDFQELVGRSVWLYPQNEVFLDLAAAWEREGGQIHWSVSETSVEGVDSEEPDITFGNEHGDQGRIESKLIVGADGSRSMCRILIPDDARTDYFTDSYSGWTDHRLDAPSA